MSEIGELVRECIDSGSRKLPDRAFTVACLAYSKTFEKVYESAEGASELEKKHFIKENWWILEFMGLKYALPLGEKITGELPKFIPGFHKNHTVQDVFLFLIRQNTVAEAMPLGFEIGELNRFEAREEKLYLPVSAAHALLGAAVFHPVNKNESVPENYWLNFGSFRTFVSELWGRQDLARRAAALS